MSMGGFSYSSVEKEVYSIEGFFFQIALWSHRGMLKMFH